jgi:hypothetical protein
MSATLPRGLLIACFSGIVCDMTQVEVFIENLKRLAANPDYEDQKLYINRLEARLLVEEIERLRGAVIRVYSFAELKEEMKAAAEARKTREKGKEVVNTSLEGA